MSTEGLSLYHYDSCPFCQRVRHALRQLGTEIELRNIHSDPGRRAELIEATGRQTVPCLRIEEDRKVRWMHESADIVRYLEERLAS